MLKISDTVLEALRAAHETGFLNRVASLLRERGIDEPLDRLAHLQSAATRRGLRSEQECATFIAFEVLLLRDPAHASWATNELSSTQALVIADFVAQAQQRCKGH